MRIFITGGTGFVGARAVSMLLDLGHDVVLLTRHPSMAAKNHANRCRVVFGDFGLPSTYAAEVRDCDAVVHCARADDRDQGIRALRDIHGSMQLLRYAAKAGVRRFVYLSSIAAYAHVPSGEIDELSPRTESREPYPFSKVWIERSLLAMAPPSVEVVILQPGNIYGSGKSWWGTGQIDLMRRGIVIVPAYGEGTANLIFVEDLVRYIIASIEVPAIGGESFLVTDGGTVRWKEYYRGLEEIVGRSSVLYVSKEEAIELSKSLLNRSIGARVRRSVSRVLLGKEVVYPLSLEAIERFSSIAVYRNDKACARLATSPRVGLQDGLARLGGYVTEAVVTTHYSR